MVKVNFAELGKKSKESKESKENKEETPSEYMFKKIKEDTELTTEEINQKIRDKRDKLKGLISEEGALFIILKEFGLDMDEYHRKFDAPELSEEGFTEESKEQTQEAFTDEEVQEEIEFVDTKKAVSHTEPKKVEPVEKPSTEIIEFNKGEIDEMDSEKQHIIREIELYNFTIQNIVKKSDYHEGNIKKSGVRKLQTAFNISTRIIDEVITQKDGICMAKYKVKAEAPSGRTAECVGAAVQNEKKDKFGNLIWSYHDTIATAQTRATSRAILDLVGFGQTSAEEINDTPTESEMAEEGW